MHQKINKFPFVWADITHSDCQLVENFVDRIRNGIFSVWLNKDDAYVVYHGTLLRIVSHLRSLSKMNHPSDFQAISAASRALFEINVDIVLLTLDSLNHPISKISFWEESAKLDRADKMVDFYAKNSTLIRPNFYQENVDFINLKGANIRSQRKTDKNGKKIHTARWTGRDLRNDAIIADGYGNFKFEEFYVLRHSPLCWNTHGSGLAGVRFISEENFPAISAIAFNESARFALKSAQLIARKFSPDVFDSEYQELDKKRSDNRLLILSNYPEVANQVWTSS